SESMPGVKGDSATVLSRLREDVKNAKEGVEMRLALLEEVFTSLQSCQWRDALDVSCPCPSTSTVSCTFESSRFIEDQVCVVILIDYSDDNDCLLSVSTNPSSTTKWYLLDEKDAPTQMISQTTTNPFRLLLSFPRSILFSSDPSTTVVIHLTKLEKHQSEDEVRLSDAFIRSPPKDSFIAPIDVHGAEEFSIESFKTITDVDPSEFVRLLYHLRMVYCNKSIPSIDVYKFHSKVGSNFDRNQCGDQTFFIGTGLFSKILITTVMDKTNYSVVLHTAFARSNEELERVVNWVIQLCD
ncbi:hypothetical protein PMAYCL1PPCAC_12095, partial [Pristionchus mayeri]